MADLMLVGEAPGYYEDKYGKPFIGAAGKILHAAVRSTGLHLKRCYITNAVRCRTTRGGTNRPPRISEIRNCNVHLVREVRMVEPISIVAMGKTAIRAFSEWNGDIPRRMPIIRDMHGKKYVVQYVGDDGHTREADLYASYHPAAGLRSSYMYDMFVADMQHIIKLHTNNVIRRMSQK